MTGQALDRPTPAGAPAEALSFGQMLERAKVLARTQLVPKPLQGRPEAIVLVGAKGAELGVPFIASLSEIHVIEGTASPSAQLRLGLIRRAGHEAQFVESSPQRAVIRGRRRERRDDPGAWTTVTWTIDQARTAGLLDVWYERWSGSDGNRRKDVWRDAERDGPRPQWATEATLKRRDNWHRYPAEMLRARAASALCRMEFSDVLTGLHVDALTPEEHGLDVGQDVDDAPDDIVVEVVDQPEIAGEPGHGGPGEPVTAPCMAHETPQTPPPGSAQTPPPGSAQTPPPGSAWTPVAPERRVELRRGIEALGDSERRLAYALTKGRRLPSLDSPHLTADQAESFAACVRQARAIEATNSVGATTVAARHALIREATRGATETTEDITAEHLAAVLAHCDALGAA